MSKKLFKDGGGPKSKVYHPKKSPYKIKKRTHRDVEHHDTTHDIFRGDEKETN